MAGFYRDATGGVPKQSEHQTVLVVDKDGVLATLSGGDGASATATYSPSDIDESGTPQYYGFLLADGGWYIMRVGTTTIRYIKGTTAYTTAWAGRAVLAYDYYDVIF